MVRQEKGVVIIVVLWVCALIMWFALQISLESRLRGEEEVHILRRSQALYMAMGGAYEALARMGYVVNPDEVEDTQVGEWQPNGRPNVVEYATGQAVVVIEEETEKANINVSSPDTIKEVLEDAGLETEDAETLVDVIGDFIDQDEFTRVNGAEKDDYEQMEIPYEPFNGALLYLDQMLLIPGVSQELFYGYTQKAKPFKKNKYKKFRDLPWPGEDSLFQNFTVYGSSTGLQTKEGTGIQEEAESGSDNETLWEDEDLDEEAAAWMPNGIYRILSCGQSNTGPPSVLLWMIVQYVPGKKPGYQVLYRKIL